ncbi:MAG TPA: peptidoglycan DD-metalloendopeptidase family protein [Tichowtungia sp.]|nr:peptidoglycan DD-metalloendopeptidase family protein [Tichowtungia sp.]HKL24958.1 peptidoglycan DD-metalloendopeptidase family protein [Desulfuromonadales bacterium]
MTPLAVGNIRDFLLIALLAFGLNLAGLTGCAPTGVYHTIQPGQTLYRIARAYEIPEAELARLNRIEDPTRLQVGQKLYIPGTSHLRQVSVAAQEPKSPPAAVKPAKPAIKTSKPSAAVAEPSKRRPPQPAKTPEPVVSAPAAKKPGFVWPLKGQVVRQFGTSKGAATKGIEISCSEGDPILAAAPGKVIYSGNGIRGYGNLIIVEHADDFFTVYGYNRKNLAKTNDYVSQSDRIAVCGQPPSSKNSRLHFEVRKGKQAVNPILYLP